MPNIHDNKIIKGKKMEEAKASSFLCHDKFKNYNLDLYKQDCKTLGLQQTWDNILDYTLNSKNKNKFLDVDNFSELYEIGLEINNKTSKKELGQYYTPRDVSRLLALMFVDLKGKYICDVGCGTGNLILEYLKLIGKSKARKLISSGCLYLYENDHIALKICKSIILKKYGNDLDGYINLIEGDFLDKNIVLPNDCKVIANPPYSNITNIPETWQKSQVGENTKELYAMFMEKIIKQSSSSVLITPYSFIGGEKFYPLRKLMNNYSGMIYSFDNVPGNIFCGRKIGVFNSNTANSVRAAITVVKSETESKGFMLTPLIRFKNEERDKILDIKVLNGLLDLKSQLVDDRNTKYCKCDKRLRDIYDNWTSKSDKKLGDYISKKGTFNISMPNTCRYYTTASVNMLKRQGQITFSVEDKDVFNYIYCLINSSFVYWHWRLFDGGITYPTNLLFNVPVFFNLLTEEDKIFFDNMAKEMISNSSKYIVTKENNGIQENIKFPKEYRDKLNQRFLNILNLEKDASVFDIIHENIAFGSGSIIELTDIQRDIIEKFYKIDATKVIYDKKARTKLWKEVIKRNNIDLDFIKTKCPALAHQIIKSYASGNNIQSAVFSECVYAQTLANMFGLNKFINNFDNPYNFSCEIKQLLAQKAIHPRYIYTNHNLSLMLIQAGGCNGTDCVLISTKDLKVCKIEFKEPKAKTSEVDLPKFGEDGKITITEDYLKKNSQFKLMLEEQKNLVIWDFLGRNIHDFSLESISAAVTNNDKKRLADVVCTEDKAGYLVMMPAKQINLWGKIEGEIRTTGRNPSKAVYTPNKLIEFLNELGAEIKNERVVISKDKLDLRKGRGSGAQVTGYKIKSLFFVRLAKCKQLKDGYIELDLHDVIQMIPTIAGKIYFVNLKYDEVKRFYISD